MFNYVYPKSNSGENMLYNLSRLDRQYSSIYHKLALTLQIILKKHVLLKNTPK